ncbi:MAG: hypothetical protein KAS32_05860 [Candidatus Peribacteraceae bacterium]|nr:hypothetical protein [Candidatus Peribacteraceae bacterium]
MPDPKSLISAYPVKELTDLVTKFKPKKLNVYIDLKNTLVSLFVPSVANDILVTSRTLDSGLDTTITQATLLISSVWKKYADRLGLDVELFICTDRGKSCYHRGIHKDYKANRLLSDMVGGTTEVLSLDPKTLNKKEYQKYCLAWAKQARDLNTKISEPIVNTIPGVHYYCLKSLEADFLPYYLISRKFKDEEGILHVVCSGDKDLYQILNLKNTVMLYKRKQKKYIVSRSSIIPLYSKFHTMSQSAKVKKSKILSLVKPDDIVAAMALAGDVSDNIPGVEGVGEITSVDMISNQDVYKKLVGTIQEAEDRVSEGGKFLKEDEIGISSLSNKWKKALISNDVVTASFKMISFEILCRWLENKSTTEKMDYLNYIDKITYKTDIIQSPSAKALHAVISQLEDYKLEDKTITNLF